MEQHNVLEGIIKYMNMEISLSAYWIENYRK